MTVFKGYLKCMVSNVRVIVMYCSIFIGVSLAMTAISGSGDETYEGTRLILAVKDQDKSLWSQALMEYLGSQHEVQATEKSQEELADDLYYNEIQYLLFLPENFKEACIWGREKIETISSAGTYSQSAAQSGSYNQYYVDMAIDDFVNSARGYLAAGYSEEETVKKVVENGAVKGEVTILAGEKTPVLYNVFRFLPYLYLGLLCFTMGMIQREYEKPDIRRRLTASCMTLRRRSLQMFFAYFTAGGMIWILASGVAAGLCLEEFIHGENQGYILLNSFTAMIFSLSTAFLAGNLVRSYGALNGIANVASLVMCFLGGVFVPIEFLSEDIRQIGQFFPTYWYSQNISILSFQEHLTPQFREKLVLGFLIQILFAVACVGIAMAVSRARQQQE